MKPKPLMTKSQVGDTQLKNLVDLRCEVLRLLGVLIEELFSDSWTPFVKSIDQSGTVLRVNKAEKMPGIIYSINGEAKSLSNEDIN